MERPQWMRQGRAPGSERPASGEQPDTGGPDGIASLWKRVPPPVRLFAAMMALMALWYGVIGTALGGITVDLALRPTAEQLPLRGSVTVGMAARLLEHQVAERAFTPNDPIFYPTGLTQRTPAFQSSFIKTVADAVEAMDSAGEPSQLTDAARSLSVDPSTWWLRAGMPPIGRPAERHFRNAADSLVRHNHATASDRPEASVDTGLKPVSRAVLQALLDRLEAEASRGNRLLRNPSEGSARVQLSSARGTAFAATMLLRAVREDNADAVRMSGRAARWGEALDALDSAATLDPLFVGKDDLVTVGYSLLLAGNAIRDILGRQE